MIDVQRQKVFYHARLELQALFGDLHAAPWYGIRRISSRTRCEHTKIGSDRQEVVQRSLQEPELNHGEPCLSVDAAEVGAPSSPSLVDVTLGALQTGADGQVRLT